MVSIFANFKKTPLAEAGETPEDSSNSAQKKKDKIRKIGVIDESEKKKTEKSAKDEPQEIMEEKPSNEVNPDAKDENKNNWFEAEGQLAVDVYQTDNEIVIQAPVAGVKPSDLDISIEKDMFIIKGHRNKPNEPSGERNYFYQECYWGNFVRKVIIPEETDPNRAEAIIKDGILTVRIPKIDLKKKKKILVKG